MEHQKKYNKEGEIKEDKIDADLKQQEQQEQQQQQ